MNVGSIVVLAVIAVLVVLAVRCSFRSEKGGCSDCAEEGCAYHGTDHQIPAGELLADGKPVACPAVDRMMGDVDRALDRSGLGRGDTVASGGARGNTSATSL